MNRNRISLPFNPEDSGRRKPRLPDLYETEGNLSEDDIETDDPLSLGSDDEIKEVRVNTDRLSRGAKRREVRDLLGL